MRICSVPGCDDKHVAHGYCGRHLQRWVKTGDPLKIRFRRAPNGMKLPERLALHTNRSGPMAYDREGNTLGPCHLWTASLNKGYGQVKSDNGRTIPAYKAAWELKNGPVTKGLELHHRCKVAICVNPDHLEPEPSLAHSAEHVGTMFRTNTSGYRNVVWSKQRKMWRAEYILDKERILVGFFTDPRKASDAVAESRLTRT